MVAERFPSVTQNPCTASGTLDWMNGLPDRTGPSQGHAIRTTFTSLSEYLPGRCRYSNRGMACNKEVSPHHLSLPLTSSHQRLDPSRNVQPGSCWWTSTLAFSGEPC